MPRCRNQRSTRSRARPDSGTIIGNAGAFPILRDQKDHQYVANLTWVVASTHSLKAGADVRRQQLDDFADNNSRGFWNFNRVECGGVTYPTAYDAFLDGCIASFTKAYDPFYLENRINEANFYAEDNWVRANDRREARPAGSTGRSPALQQQEAGNLS